jgi:two-component system chemotaxis sensor kinase CheA
MDELRDQFVIEAAELVQQAAEDLLALEREPASRPHIESLFRAVHTLKGSVGLFDFAPLQRTLHAAEDVLTKANRAGELDASMIDPLIAIIEWTDRCVRDVASTGHLPDGAPAEGLALSAALTGTPDSPRAVPQQTSVPEWAAQLFEAQPAGVTAIRYVPRPDCFFSGDDPVALLSTVPQLL